MSCSRLLDVVLIDRGQLRPVDRAHDQISKVVARACQTLIWGHAHTSQPWRHLACGLPQAASRPELAKRCGVHPAAAVTKRDSAPSASEPSLTTTKQPHGHTTSISSPLDIPTA